MIRISHVWPVERDEITQAKLVLLSLFLLCHFMNETKKNKTEKGAGRPDQPTLYKRASNHHANLPLEMYSFTL